MKETTGASILMYLATAIILVFITMVVFFISYGQTFKIKNRIINKIEQNEGLPVDAIKLLDPKGTINNDPTKKDVCLNLIKTGSNLRGFTVEVTVYMKSGEGILDFIPDIPIRGETRIIESGKYFDFLNGDYMHGENLNIPPC